MMVLVSMWFGGFVRSASPNEMTHTDEQTDIDVHVRTGVRWVTAHSTHTLTEIYKTCSLFLCLHATAGEEDTVD